MFCRDAAVLAGADDPIQDALISGRVCVTTAVLLLPIWSSWEKLPRPGDGGQLVVALLIRVSVVPDPGPMSGGC